MADINCPRCGEPWDIDSVHEEISVRHYPFLPEGEDYQKEFSRIQAEFYKRGCVTFEGVSVECAQSESFKAQASAALYDLLGDDVDGIAAMLEDVGDDW